jgi:hypothetical protein
VPAQPTPEAPACQDAPRWGRADVAAAFDHFQQPERSSQRHYAAEHDVPRSTLGYWLRRDAADSDPVAAFCHSAAGQQFLKAVVLSALTTFCLQGACGIRLLSAFLRRAGLDRFVAPSRGAWHPLLTALQAQLAAFDDLQRPLLAERMPAKAIALALDEHFHAVKPCLVAVEPVSDFILFECYRDRRDADTWTKAIQDGTRDMKGLEVVLLTSDLARGLLCCAEKGLGVAHSPDLFHGQRDLLKGLMFPLARPIRQAREDLEKANKRVERLDVPKEQVQPPEEFNALLGAVRAQLAVESRLEEAQERQEKAVREVRGVGDDYHPFDRQTGRPLSAEEVGERLKGRVAALEGVVEEAGLGEGPQAAVGKASTWVTTLMGCVAWFWGVVGARLEEMELSEQQEQEVREKLLAGHYWEMAGPRARTAEEKKRVLEMAAGLKKEAWRKGGALAGLAEEERKEVERLAKESAGLFARSSSCVEGRNGRLSLHHHGHGKVSAARLKALGVVHNYLVRRADGSTAAERFFEQKHADVFAWLLQRMPDLPRPAAKRSPAAESLPCSP